MHKTCLLVLIFAAMASSLPQRKDPIAIISSVSDVRWDGSYNFHYESADGSVRVEEGHVVNQGTKDEHVAVKGSYRYISPDGRTISVIYTADDNGFVPRTEASAH